MQVTGSVEKQITDLWRTMKVLYVYGKKQSTDRNRAKLLLRKKKFQEQILSRTDQQLENLEKMTHDLEFAVIKVQVVQGLKLGNMALKRIQTLICIEDIEKILDETQEAVEKQLEIDELLSGLLTTEDEDDILDELNSIMKETMPDGGCKNNPVGLCEPGHFLEDQLELPDIPAFKLDLQGQDVQKKRKQLLETS